MPDSGGGSFSFRVGARLQRQEKPTLRDVEVVELMVLVQQIACQSHDQKFRWVACQC